MRSPACALSYAFPFVSRGELIGFVAARRTEVRPFTPEQIKLLETFADQAVIAIENVRLFEELKESLEQQTATSEILGVIASSPTDIQPVLDAVAQMRLGFAEPMTQRFVLSKVTVMPGGTLWRASRWNARQALEPSDRTSLATRLLQRRNGPYPGYGGGQKRFPVAGGPRAREFEHFLVRLCSEKGFLLE